MWAGHQRRHKNKVRTEGRTGYQLSSIYFKFFKKYIRCMRLLPASYPLFKTNFSNKSRIFSEGSSQNPG